MKISQKITLAAAAVTLVGVAVFGAIDVRHEIAIFENAHELDVLLVGRTMRLAVDEVWDESGESRALRFLRGAEAQSDTPKVRWVARGAFASLDLTTDRRAALEHGDEFAYAERKGTGKLVAYVPYERDGYVVGAIEVSESLAPETAFVRAAVKEQILATIVVIMLVSALAMAIGEVFVGRALRRMVEQARKIGSGDFSDRVELKQSDELSALATEMNVMSDSLQEAKEQTQRATEARILALEHLRHADRLATVGKLASGIAHELGTPLSVVRGRAQMIQSGPAKMPEKHAAIIEQQATRMAEIIRQLLDFARRGDRPRGRVDLLVVLRRVNELLGPLAEKSGVRSAIEHADETYLVEGDAAQIEQVVMNLAVNAIHAMKGGGTLGLAVSREPRQRPAESDEPSESSTVACVVLSVSDTGSGIDEENTNRIFEPFFTTKPIGAGTGLGLSVAYGIIRDHGGWIDVESELGEGSRFDVCFPDVLPTDAQPKSDQAGAKESADDE